MSATQPHKLTTMALMTLTVVALTLGACASTSRTAPTTGSTTSSTTVAPGTATTVAPGTTTTVAPGTGGGGQSTVGPATSVSATPGTGTTGTGPPPTATPTSPPPTTAAPSPPSGGGVYGYVTAGPTCPVERIDHPCPPRPVQATVAAQNSSGQTIASTSSDSSGRYAMSLPAGTYTVVATYPRCAPTTVTVGAGASTRADVSCDTGIR